MKTKSKLPIEIYEAVFTDGDLQGTVKEINGQKLTKADLIKKIEVVDAVAPT